MLWHKTAESSYHLVKRSKPFEFVSDAVLTCMLCVTTVGVAKVLSHRPKYLSQCFARCRPATPVGHTKRGALLAGNRLYGSIQRTRTACVVHEGQRGR